MKFDISTDIPADWSMLPLKRIARLVYGDSLASDARQPGEIAVFGSNGPFDRHSLANTLAPCIIVGRKGSYGKIQFSEKPVFAVDTTFMIDERHTSANLRFLFYMLSALGLDALSDDTAIPGLSRAKAHQSLCPVPPPSTQGLIADFLDKRTALIDDLIAKKNRLLELLVEKRRALIARTIAEDTEEPQKVWKLSHAYSYIGSGTTPFAGNSDYYDPEFGFPWVTTSELRENTITSTKMGVTDLALGEHSALRKYPAGSLLIAMYGATIGRLGILGVEAVCNQACCAFTFSPVVNNKYLFYWFWHRREKLISLSAGGGQPNLNQAELRKERICCPPLEIQERAVNFLDEQVEKIREADSKIRLSIKYLQEYRAALITNAVTGQMDVGAA